MAIGRITGQMLSSTLSRATTDLTIATTGDSALFHVDATNDRIGIGLNNPTVQFQTSGNVIVGGNLTVNGTTNTINSTTVTVDDKNIELGSTDSPSDAGADGGGITLKGDSDKTINWVNSTGFWTSNVGWDTTAGNAYHIGGTQVLDANNLDLENININGNVISSNSNADISIQPAGTGVLKVNGIQIDGDVITSDDSSVVQFGEGVNVNGNLDVGGNLTLSNGTAVASIVDEDNMASNSATALATQQSIKAYVDAEVAGVSTTSISEGNSSVAVADSGTGTVTITLDGNTEMTVTDAGMQLGGSGARVSTILDEDAMGSDSDTALATQQSIKAYVDAQDAAIASDTLTFTNKTFDANGSGNSLSNVEVADFAASAIVIEAEGIGSNDNDTTIPTSAAVKDYVDGVAGGTLALGDDSSNAGSVDVNGGQDLEFHSGNSITATVGGNGVEVALNDEIVVNAISSSASTFVRINDSLETEAAQINSTLTVDGDATIKGNLSVEGTTTYLETTNTKITDPVLMLNNGNSGGSDIDAGILVERGSAGNNAVWYWNEGDDRWKAVLSTSNGEGTSVTDSSYATVNVGGLVFSAESVVADSILDEDGFGSDSATALATQQSIKAYVDAQDANIASDTLTFTNKTFDANGSGNSLSNVEVADMAASAVITVAETLASNDSDSAFVTAGAIIDYVDAQDANIASDTLTFTNKTFDANGTGNSISNIDFADFTSGVVLDEDDMSSNSATNLATQQSIKAYVDSEVSGVSISALNDIGNVDAAAPSDGDVLIVNDDSSNVFTASSQMVTALRVPNGTTAQRPTVYTGAIRFNTTTGKYEGSTDGSTFVAFAMEGGADSLNKDVFSGDGSASYNFSNVSDPTSVASGTSNGALGLIVYIDNVLQEPTQNYTVSATAITFDSAVHSGARIVVIQGFDSSVSSSGGTGAGFQTIGNTDVDSAVENVDTFGTSTYRGAHYHYMIENDDAGEYQTGQIHVIHDGTNAQITEFGVLRTGSNDLITFTVDVDSGLLRLRGSAQTPNSKFTAKRVSLEVQ